MTALARESAFRSGLARFRLSNHASDGYGTPFFDVRGPDALDVSKTPGQILWLARIRLPKPNEVRGFVPKSSLVYFPSSLFAITERSALEGEGTEPSKRKAAALSVKAGWVLLLPKQTRGRLGALAAEADREAAGRSCCRGWLAGLSCGRSRLGGRLPGCGKALASVFISRIVKRGVSAGWVHGILWGTDAFGALSAFLAVARVDEAGVPW